MKGFSKKNFLIFLTLFIFLSTSALLFCSCSMPNTISNYMNEVNNNGAEEELINSQNHLDMLNDAITLNSRADYPNLSDEEFANFKAVDALGLKPNFLYRCASPIDTSSQRCFYADNLLKQNNIKNIINLEDTQDTALKYQNYSGTYYSQQNILFAPIESNLNTQKSKDSINLIMNFIANTDGPIAIHCKDGASKTGIICALLQALNVAGYDYLKVEYITAYLHLYKTDLDLTDALNMRFRNNLSKVLDLTNHNVIYTNLNKYTNIFYQSCSIDNQTITTVKDKLKNSD